MLVPDRVVFPGTGKAHGYVSMNLVQSDAVSKLYMSSRLNMEKDRCDKYMYFPYRRPLVVHKIEATANNRNSNRDFCFWEEKRNHHCCSGSTNIHSRLLPPCLRQQHQQQEQQHHHYTPPLRLVSTTTGSRKSGKMIRTGLLLLLSLLGLVHVAPVASSEEGDLPQPTEFRVRGRRNENRKNRELFKDELFLTFSDDGRSKTLDNFVLVMFDTPTELQIDAVRILRMAMNKFLLTEFNEIYTKEGNMVSSVGSEVLWDRSTTSNPGPRALQPVEVGREAEMQVTFKFDREPSPSRVDLEEKIREVMADLTTFVTNLTSFGHSDWADVTEAYRLEIGTDAPTATPADSKDGVEGPTGDAKPTSSDRGSDSVAAIIPSALVAATLITIIIFLLVQRRRRSGIDVFTRGGATTFAGVENDVYSFDRSLESARSPYEVVSVEETSPYEEKGQQVSASLSDSTDFNQDSTFCGLDYKHGNTIITNLTTVSAATDRASNNKDMQDHEQGRTNPGSSTFSYRQELPPSPYEQEDTPRDYEKTSGASQSRASFLFGDDRSRSAPNSPAIGARRDGGGARQESPFACYPSNPESDTAAGNSSHEVLADLEMFESKRAPSREASPQPAKVNKPTGSLYANLFSCNPTMPVLERETRDDREVKAAASNTSFLSCSPGVPTSYETPLTRNASDARITAGGGTPSAKSGHMVYDVNGRLVSLNDSAIQTSNSKPPVQSGSKSVPSSPERSRHRASMFRSLPGWRTNADYEDNLDQPPSTPGDDMENSLKEFKNTAFGGRYFPFTKSGGQKDGSDAYQTGAMSTDGARRHAGNIQGSDGSSMYQTGAVGSHSARRHAGNTGMDGTAMYQNDAMSDTRSGRRHVDKTNMDGTALYQENTMNPMEWSYNPTDNQSLGESPLSDQDGEVMPRQFLFGRRLSRSAKTNKSNPGEGSKTPHSHQTQRSSPASAASRNVISDLVWLEQKVAGVRQGAASDARDTNSVDSLSYVSDNRRLSDPSSQGSEIRTEKNESVMSSIVCRDCFAPPGKLHIVIHSTKDGPAVHTVKPGSSLEGHIFPGDLIISVDNVDTRSYSAEQVMKMMAAKSNQERKITVLHFDEED